jgi:hypothetical protein
MAENAERKRRRKSLEDAAKVARSHQKFLFDFAEWLDSGNERAVVISAETACAYGQSFHKVCGTIDRLIGEGIEARMSKWEMEDKVRELELEVARLKWVMRCTDG